ncbi:hypothetical protein BDV95DRAFT_612110 [Massariosphaeria phaeospora]|uniref:TOM core complex subunit Tom6 n=1 Tax=Massariosphaeria phaeospora TaxID=100035 RepID=A0A7C8M4Y7_9PLEO|nr:hypothetical protein BDV95DRAFT_612110 [Massariosphaeria phaeospora]
MPPKSNFAGKGRTIEEPSYARGAVQTLISPDNRSIITAVGLFAIGVTFLQSNWADILLPA